MTHAGRRVESLMRLPCDVGATPALHSPAVSKRARGRSVVSSLFPGIASYIFGKKELAFRISDQMVGRPDILEVVSLYAVG